MAHPDGNPAPAVTLPPELAALVERPSEYDFFVALRWVQARLASRAIGTALTTGEEHMRLAQKPTLGFAPSAIAGAAWNEELQRLDLKLSFTGLLGPNGPMPIHFTEYVLDRVNHFKDGTLAAFLDIFHHRIYTLFYRAWALNQQAVDFEPRSGRRHVHYVRCLVGMGTGSKEQRDSVPDLARLYYSGWLGGLRRSPSGLAAILSDFLQVPVELRTFQGMWVDLPADTRCRLGESRATGVLGSTCYAGERSWVVHLKFRIRFGPLSRAQYESLLPGGAAFQQVTEWVRSFVGDEFFWEAQLLLNRAEVPACCLGQGTRLGWSTWLGEPPAGRPAEDLIVQAA